jgi:hypothetical protein
MADELRALTIRQPWAGCIAHLDKRVENRTRPAPRRLVGSTIAIHAGLAMERRSVQWMPDGEKFATLFASQAEWDAWRLWHLGGRNPRDNANWPPKLALGAVVAVARVTGSHLHRTGVPCGDGSYAYGILCSPWAQPDQWHWQLTEVRPLAEPVPCKGSLALGWPLPDDVDHQVRAQLKEVTSA